eukprot:gene30485-36846_t
MKLVFVLLIALAVICLVAGKALRGVQGYPGSDVQTPTGKTLLKTGPKGSKLFTLNTPNAVYSDPVYLLDLAAPTPYDQGYDAGFLLGKATVENFDSLMKALLGDEWWEPAIAALIGEFLDWQWTDYLSKQVPQDYMDEIRGITAGGKAAGLKKDVGAITGWGITLANFPGSLENLKFILQDEMNTNSDFAQQLKAMHMTVDQLME